ncbi:hypothetical protein AT728_07275 [Streptomyces silvensis]|uniref:Uncharacterized protein n=1 Tax=Streptomyces silvensis TaxID=1765722 RepID=A0A0W7X7K1_9ACTN|nr:hypothetical protein AT728_07275 [Streptomyces silvensis]
MEDRLLPFPSGKGTVHRCREATHDRDHSRKHGVGAVEFGAQGRAQFIKRGLLSRSAWLPGGVPSVRVHIRHASWHGGRVFQGGDELSEIGYGVIERCQESFRLLPDCDVIRTVGHVVPSGNHRAA